MRRIMVIGCCGAGKSTFSRSLNAIIKLPVLHLDQYYWKPDWTETPQSEWEPIVQELAARDQWIIDGNYGSSMDVRIARADTIFYLDFPIWKCLWRVIKRVSKYHGKRRPDMPEGCHERFDLEFLHYVATFNILRRRSILKKLDRASKHANIIILTSDEETAAYLEELKQELQPVS